MNIVGHLKHALLDVHAGWVMWMLLGLSVISLGLMFERALFFFSVRGNVAVLSSRLDGLLRSQSYREALDLMTASRCPEAAAVVAGLRHADLGPASAEKAMSGALALERMKLERGLAFLATLGNNAPFIGLLRIGSSTLVRRGECCRAACAIPLPFVVRTHSAPPGCEPGAVFAM